MESLLREFAKSAWRNHAACVMITKRKNNFSWRMAKVYIEYNVPPSLRVVGRAFLRWCEELRRVGASFFRGQGLLLPASEETHEAWPCSQATFSLTSCLIICWYTSYGAFGNCWSEYRSFHNQWSFSFIGFFFQTFFLDSFKSKYSFISPSKAVSSQNNRGSMMDSLDHSSLKKKFMSKWKLIFYCFKSLCFFVSLFLKVRAE